MLNYCVIIYSIKVQSALKGDNTMEQNKLNAIMMQYKDAIPDEQVLNFKNLLQSAPDAVYDNLLCIPTKSTTTTLLLSIFLGGLGADRFYLGDTGLGICKLLFGWLTFGIWPLVDIFCSYKKAKRKNFVRLTNALAGVAY